MTRRKVAGIAQSSQFVLVEEPDVTGSITSVPCTREKKAPYPLHTRELDVCLSMCVIHNARSQ